MGIAGTVCTIAAYSTMYVIYNSTSGASTSYNAIVNGGNCSFLFDGDAGEIAQIFNTTGGINRLLNLTCTASSLDQCYTNYMIFNSPSYSLQELNAEELNITSRQLEEFFVYSYYALPPVPSQTPKLQFTNSNLSLALTTSPYSTEYGAALQGCVIASGPTPYTGGDLPLMLAPVPSQTSLPSGAVGFFTALAQNQSHIIALQDLSVAPSSSYDFHWVCYNSNGRSPITSLYKVQTSSALPTGLSSSSTGGKSSPGNGAERRAEGAARVVSTILAFSIIAVLAW